MTPEGIAHVMRLFSAHYLQSAPGPADAADRHAAALKQEIAHVATIICDEELLGRGRSTATTGAVEKPRRVEKSPYANAFAEPDAGRGGIDAPDWTGERLPADGAIRGRAVRGTDTRDGGAIAGLEGGAGTGDGVSRERGPARYRTDRRTGAADRDAANNGR